MKTFGQIILGAIAIFIGITIFNYTESTAFHKAVGEQGDAAYLNDDLEFFKNRFEYHKDTPLFEESVLFELSDEYLEENKLEDIENKEVSLDIYIFQSANIVKNKGNYLTFLIKDLILPEEISEPPYLDLYFTHSSYKPKKVESIGVVKIGDENWYLQWVQILLDDIVTFTLKQDDLVLYEYDEEEPLLKAEEHDLIRKIEKKDKVQGIVKGFSEEKLELSYERNYEPDEIVEYELDFLFRLNEDLDIKEDLYLSGEFNNWEIGNERYKLVKTREGIYKTKINYDSGYDEMYFTLTTLDGKSAIDNNEDVEYFVYNFINQEDELSDYDIVESFVVTFTEYNYYKYISLGVYVGVIAIVVVIIAVVVVQSNKKERAKYAYLNKEKAKPESDKEEEI